MTFSPELTFVPAAAPHTIATKAEAERLVKRLTRTLKCRLFYVKHDPHLNEWTNARTYCIEVVPTVHWHTEWLENSDWRVLRRYIVRLFRCAADLGLVPSVITREAGEDIHWPGGGSHLHISADFYSTHAGWYRQMETFHRNLATDLANRPYIRWLFKQWFADESGTVLVNRGNYDTVVPRMEDPDYILSVEQSVCPRFMGSSKTSYLTFEHRQFSMVDNADEVRAIVRVATRWTNYLRDLEKPVRFTLTKRALDEMATVRGARAHCREWIKLLGLPWADYEPFFQRFYKPRILWGEMI